MQHLSELQLRWLPQAVLVYDYTAVRPFVLELSVNGDPDTFCPDLVEVSVGHEAEVRENETIEDERVVSLAEVAVDASDVLKRDLAASLHVVLEVVSQSATACDGF